MRKVIYSLTNSLDNFIARADGGADWILLDDEMMQEFPKLSEKFDTVLIGRKTFDYAFQQNPDANEGAGEGAGGFMGMKTYVFSRTLKEPLPRGVTLISEHAGEFVRQLKNESGKDLWLMGGGELAASLFKEKLIDEIGLAIQPVLLSAGVPLFPGLTAQLGLELLECKTYKCGVVALAYRVKY
jgi:dihydrofolate reductase